MAILSNTIGRLLTTTLSRHITLSHLPCVYILLPLLHVLFFHLRTHGRTVPRYFVNRTVKKKRCRIIKMVAWTTPSNGYSVRTSNLNLVEGVEALVSV